jgi:S-adenosylmethionine:tRNA ribosyltransferase-isomerase
VLVSSFDFQLPPELIAQQPLPNRSDPRLLHLKRLSGMVEDRHFRDFPDLLRPDDLVVFNNSRVFPARLFGRRSGSKSPLPLGLRTQASVNSLEGRIEVLLTRQISTEPNDWECLVRPGRKIGVGRRLFFGDQGELQAEVISRASFGERRLRFDRVVGDFFVSLERLGHIPLPPYIDRADCPEDKERYQTIFARERGSVAAPTAGLHFTDELLTRMKDRGIETAELTLHVGLGTFLPVRVSRVEGHKLHRESYNISPEAADGINSALDTGRRVIAVGTTTVRTLEYSAILSGNGRVRPGAGEADVFIYPGYEFRVVKGILTNFHLPQSTLLMLVCAFADQKRVLAAYSHAVEQKYRFYSYGDCMFVE